MHTHLYNSKEKKDFSNDFQTPMPVAHYMVQQLSRYENIDQVFEPTPGIGNLVKAIGDGGYSCIVPPDNYFHHQYRWFDAVVMNPPFSSKYLVGEVPEEYRDAGMRAGYKMLLDCMKLSNIVVALMPTFTITDSDVRLRHIMDYGLVSITSLPRKTFNYARIQTVILHLERGYTKETVFRLFNF